MKTLMQNGRADNCRHISAAKNTPSQISRRIYKVKFLYRLFGGGFTSSPPAIIFLRDKMQCVTAVLGLLASAKWDLAWPIIWQKSPRHSTLMTRYHPPLTSLTVMISSLPERLAIWRRIVISYSYAFHLPKR